MIPADELLAELAICALVSKDRSIIFELRCAGAGELAASIVANLSLDLEARPLDVIRELIALRRRPRAGNAPPLPFAADADEDTARFLAAVYERHTGRFPDCAACGGNTFTCSCPARRAA